MQLRCRMPRCTKMLFRRLRSSLRSSGHRTSTVGSRWRSTWSSAFRWRKSTSVAIRIGSNEKRRHFLATTTPRIHSSIGRVLRRSTRRRISSPRTPRFRWTATTTARWWTRRSAISIGSKSRVERFRIEKRKFPETEWHPLSTGCCTSNR